MRLIKLFEQWVSEEEKPVDSPKVEDTAKPSNSYNLKVSSTEAGDFEVTATADLEATTDLAKSFKVISSTNSNIKSGATIMVSPKADKAGDFDIVAINDKNKPEESLIYSGKVETTKS
jgi:hypothetical protein